MKTHQFTFVAVLLSIAIASYSQNSKDYTRKGFVFATSIGGGIHLEEGATYGRLSLPNIKIGTMLHPNWGVMLYAPGGSYRPAGEGRAFEGFFPTVQYWVTDQFYLNGGAGLAIETTPFYKVDFSQGPPAFNTGFGFTVSAGHEILQWSENKTIDVQLRLLYGQITFQDESSTDNIAIDLLIGFNLY